MLVPHAPGDLGTIGRFGWRVSVKIPMSSRGVSLPGRLVASSIGRTDGCLQTEVVVIGGDNAFRLGPLASDLREDFVTLIVS